MALSRSGLGGALGGMQRWPHSLREVRVNVQLESKCRLLMKSDGAHIKQAVMDADAVSLDSLFHSLLLSAPLGFGLTVCLY